MNILNVGLVLLDEPVEGQGVEPDGVIDVAAVLVGMLAVKVLAVQGLLQSVAPLANSLAWKHDRLIRVPINDLWSRN